VTTPEEIDITDAGQLRAALASCRRSQLAVSSRRAPARPLA
jgi:hypothetical protein